jgi:DNA helicase-2/ATP-dependent DNA helicase PcrA
MPLTVSYRCPRAVVAHAQEYVSHIQAAPEAIEGSVETIDQIKFWRNESKSLLKDDAILCRNTKPLIDLAFELIRNDLGCHVEGREIGESLIKLVDKFPRARTLDDLRDSLVDYKRAEMDRLYNLGQEAKAAGIEDRVDTLLVVIENLDGKGDPMEVKLKLSILFGDTTPGQPSPSTTLATIHKSKGREWNRVFIWGANKFQPSPFAKKDWQKEQENNLRYVSITRAKQRLVEVNVL